MEIAAINIAICFSKTITIFIKNKGILYLINLLDIACLYFFVFIVILVAFLFYFAKYALIKAKRRIFG